MSITTTSGPGCDPVRLDEAKRHLGISQSDSSHDELVAAKLTAAAKIVEDYIGRDLIQRTHVYRRDAFPDEDILLPRWPVLSVTSIQYYDTAGVLQTLDAADYTVDIYTEPARIGPSYGNTWPSTRDIKNAVLVTFTAGYGTEPNTVPKKYREMVLLMLGGLFSDRELNVIGVVPNRVGGPGALDALMGQEGVPGYADDEDEPL